MFCVTVWNIMTMVVASSILTVIDNRQIPRICVQCAWKINNFCCCCCFFSFKKIADVSPTIFNRKSMLLEETGVGVHAATTTSTTAAARNNNNNKKGNKNKVGVEKIALYTYRLSPKWINSSIFQLQKCIHTCSHIIHKTNAIIWYDMIWYT